MNLQLKALENRVRDGRFVSELAFKVAPLEQIVELRYTKDFEPQWLRVFDELEKIKKNGSLSSDVQDAILNMEDVVYESVFAWTSDSELAGLVYDDIELIALAIALGYEDPWLSALAKSYLQNEFPRGKLVLTNEKLSDLIS